MDEYRLGESIGAESLEIEQRLAIIKQLTKQVENNQLRRAIKYQINKLELELRSDNLGDEVITVTGR